MAEELFEKKFETKSAGLYNSTPVTKKQLQWADTVIVMEDTQRSELAKRFPKEYIQKRIITLEIPDIYNYGNSKLKDLLQEKMEEYADLF